MKEEDKERRRGWREKRGNDISYWSHLSLIPSLFLFLCILLFALFSPSSSSASRLLLVDVLAADDLVNDPVENVKNEEDEREGHAGHRVDALCPADEQLLHLLDAFLGRGRGRGVVVVALDGHAVFGLEAGGAHAVAGEAEAPLACFILLQHRPRLRLLGTRERRYCWRCVCVCEWVCVCVNVSVRVLEVSTCSCWRCMCVCEVCVSEVSSIQLITKIQTWKPNIPDDMRWKWKVRKEVMLLLCVWIKLELLGWICVHIPCCILICHLYWSVWSNILNSTGWWRHR